MADASNIPRFAVGNEVSSGHHVFKSSFARSFVNNALDTKSLDYHLLGDLVDSSWAQDKARTDRNNQFFSLVDFANSEDPNENLGDWKGNETDFSGTTELQILRKQCLMLAEENRRLQNAVTSTQVSDDVEVIDNIYLQTQVDTLQWQLKQTEASRHMYRSLMVQVVRFLNRAHKSLDILHEKNNCKGKKSNSVHAPRSRSVHAAVPAVPAIPAAPAVPELPANSAASSSCTSSATKETAANTTSSTGSSSRFTRAKSATQISPCTMGFREFTWSVLRRNDPVNSTPPRGKASQNLNKTHEGIAYRRPAQPELNPDDVPPMKLSQEAFRLMRTVQSLLSMREPDLARITSTEGVASSSSSPDDNRPEDSLNAQSENFVNSTSLPDADRYNGCSSSDRGNESSSAESGTGSPFLKQSVIEADRNLQSLLPGVRRSIDATSVNSGSSKSTTEEEDGISMMSPLNVSLTTYHGVPLLDGAATSTPKKHAKKTDKKETEKSKSKTATSVSSVEDESGFSSMNSFQEVGLPTALQRFPIKGCHDQLGIPVVPPEKARHRRWSSTPNEMRSLFKQHRASFTGPQTTTAESMSVWV